MREEGQRERFGSLEKTLRSIHRGVQVVRDKQELAEARADLAKLAVAEVLVWLRSSALVEATTVARSMHCLRSTLAQLFLLLKGFIIADATAKAIPTSAISRLAVEVLMLLMTFCFNAGAKADCQGGNRGSIDVCTLGRVNR